MPKEDYNYRDFDADVQESYSRFVEKSGAILVNPNSIKLTLTGGSEVTVKQFWGLFSMWPLWDRRTEDILMEAGSIKLKELPGTSR